MKVPPSNYLLIMSKITRAIALCFNFFARFLLGPYIQLLSLGYNFVEIVIICLCLNQWYVYNTSGAKHDYNSFIRFTIRLNHCY